MSQQSPGGRGIIQRQTVDRRIDQYLTLAFNPFYRLKVCSAPATRVSAVERGPAKRTALHRSRLKIEQQILQLPACIRQRSIVAAAPGVSDHLDQVDDLRAVFLAGFI